MGGILQAIFYSVRVSQSPHAEPFSFHQLAFHNAVYYLTLDFALLEGVYGCRVEAGGCNYAETSPW